MATPKTAVAKAAPKANTPAPAPAKSVAVEVLPPVVESDRPLTVLSSLVVNGKPTGELSAKEYSTLIAEKISNATMGLRQASLLGYQASLAGVFQKTLEHLQASGEFSYQTLAGLSQTVTKTIPFLLGQGANLDAVKNLDGFRDLIPKVAIADRQTGKLEVAKGSEEIVKRAIAGESPRKLVEEIKAAAGDDNKGGGGASTVASRLVNVVKSVEGVKNPKHAKQDGSTFARQAGRAAAIGGLKLDEAIALLTTGYNSESEAMLKRSQAAEAAEIKKAEAAKAKKEKAAEKKAEPKKAKLVAPKKKK